MNITVNNIRLFLSLAIINKMYQLIPKILKNIINLFLLPLEIYLVRLNQKKFEDINDVMEFVFNFNFVNIFFIQQNWNELHKLLEIVKIKKPHIIVEIGTAGGGTLFIFSYVIKNRGFLISVDLDNVLWKRIFYKKVIDKSEVVLFKGNSHNINIFNKVKELLKGREVDFLFIDADHSYEGVKKDFEMYSQIVRKGGIIAFHDILTKGVHGWNVSKFWDEVKLKYESIEIIEDYKNITGGIGIIVM